METTPAPTKEALAHGRDFVLRDLPYRFTAEEEKAIQPFFTNLRSRVFFMHSLPANVGASLLAMYSRIRNPRGLRGLFVDTFLPQLLSGFLAEVADRFKGDEQAFLKEYKVKSLRDFVLVSKETLVVFDQFLGAFGVDPEFTKRLAESKKVKKFLSMWLDKYGHNSIARTGSVWIGCEMISVLAAKSIEWTRPGAGYIELSTRYVDFSGKDCYPTAEEAALYGADSGPIAEAIKQSFNDYAALAGSAVDGIFPKFLRDRYQSFYSESEKELKNGVTGETFDVLGNLLPASTLTSVGISVSGESLPSILRHLLLDNTPETIALAEMMVAESEKIGANQFARYYEPTPWEKQSWQYLDPEKFQKFSAETSSGIREIYGPDASEAERILHKVLALRGRSTVSGSGGFSNTVSALREIPRGDHDKLPREFESVAVACAGVMSFRGWRDLHRQSFSTHKRTLLSPALGFYVYNKPAPSELHDAFNRIFAANKKLEAGLARVPREIRQYAMALGNRVGFLFGANLRQHEFCNWQRTKFSVNHEVREVFVSIEESLRKRYPWWKDLSRADLTKAYVFARTENGLPLSQAEKG